MARKKLPWKTERDVLVRSRRRCCICYGLLFDSSIKKGQLAHLDKNRDNNEIDNLAFLCMPHHDEYDSRPSQSKGFGIEEVKSYRDELDELLKRLGDQVPWTDNPAPSPDTLEAGPVEGGGNHGFVTLDVYERRLPIYRAAYQFLLAIMREGNASLEDLRELVSATDEALFLFGDEVAQYLDRLYHEGVQIRAIGKRLDISRSHPERFDIGELARQEEEKLNWFGDQLTVCRKTFQKYMTLAPNSGGLS